MIISCREDCVGYRDDAYYFEVYLDGRLLDLCYAADEEADAAWCDTEDYRGIRIHSGKVQIVDMREIDAHYVRSILRMSIFNNESIDQQLARYEQQLAKYPAQAIERAKERYFKSAESILKDLTVDDVGHVTRITISENGALPDGIEPSFKMVPPGTIARQAAEREQAEPSYTVYGYVEKTKWRMAQKDDPQQRWRHEGGVLVCSHCKTMLPASLGCGVNSDCTARCPFCGWSKGRCDYCCGLMVSQYRGKPKCQDCNNEEKS